ncbi:integrase catalytic domain-containing protein [Trichonephila clavipes]|uniref:Integrase catalytic domain-containing protein n=1 Tax=Trichonephila clavipes TaxID=2585209 RepID=A0A8X6R7P3_TRICX|nr:integrase catalytic domain-containing protein [Trichonephila clavipes]
MLLGAQVFFKIFKADQIKINDSVTFQNSVFNYIVTGGLPAADDKQQCFLLSEKEGFESLISKFWQLESIEDEPRNLNSQAKFCEEHFVNNHRRDESGQYIVQVTILKEPSGLGESKQTAIRRIDSLWRKLDINPNLKQLYRNFIHEYLYMGHMEQLSDESEPTVSYYMPHHGALRLDSKSTPLRTVFDASCSTSNRESLNSILANGGVIQDELFAILLRFRKNEIALTSDIKKMFRMIFIDESQKYLLRIVWKDSIDDSIKTYRMNRLVYGTTCAPFLAQRVLKQLVTDDGHKYPGAGMQLHKWSSNCIELLSNFDGSDADVSLTIPDETKALGLLWRPQKDTSAFSVSSIADVSDSSIFTKRSVLSATARIFDPLGLISPVVTKAKLVMQELGRLKLDWNDSLPIHLETQWKRFVKSLAAINNLNIPRYNLLDDAQRIELHGYCDSSLRDYGAAIYVKCLHNSGTVSTNLLCSKSRIAPLKSVTIPRLELCAAVLLAKLIQKTIKSMKIPFNDIVLWTDSTIVLAWIKEDPSVLKPFVKNRVSVIQHLTEVSSWKHVQSQENHADIISRGIDPDKIQYCVLLWYAPPVLQNNPVVSSCDINEINDNDLYLSEFKKSDPVCLITQNVELLPVINKCSSFVKLKRIIA